METTLLAIKKSNKENNFATEEEFLQDILFDAGISTTRATLTGLDDLCDILKVSICPTDDEHTGIFKKAFKNYATEKCFLTIEKCRKNFKNQIIS